MPRFDESTVIRAPIAMVFEALTDPKRGMDWNPNIIDVSQVSQYPVAEGTTWIQVVVVQGRPLEMHCRIEAFDPPVQGCLQVTGAQRATIWTRCEEVGASTRVTQTVEFVMPGGRLGALAGGLVKGALQKEFSRTLARQRSMLEIEFGAASESSPH